MEINLMNLIVGMVVCLIVYYIITVIPLQAPFRQIIMLIYGLFVFFWLLGALGIWNGASIHIGQ